MSCFSHREFHSIALTSVIFSLVILINSHTVWAKGISLSETQVSSLAATTNWKLELHEDFGSAKNYKGFQIEKDIRRLFQYAGWEINPANVTTHDASLEITISAKPIGCSYTTGRHYTAAEVSINAVMKDDQSTWTHKFEPSTAKIGCPFFISSSFTKPERAPFQRAYLKNKDFFKQLIWMVYQTKGDEPLSIAMKDGTLNKDIRNYVQTVSGETSDRRFSIPLLVNLNSDRFNLKITAIEALAQLGDDKAIPSLSKVLRENKNSGVRAAAAQALGQLGDQRVADALSEALREDQHKEVRDKASKALARIGWQPNSIKDKIIYALANDNSKVINDLGPEAIPVLIELLDHPNSDIRKESAHLLGESKAKMAAAALGRILANDKVTAVRIQAAKSLGSIGTASSIPSLSIALLEDKDRKVRVEAVQALVKMDDPKVANVITKAMLEDKDRSVRKQAAQKLALLGWKPQSAQIKVQYCLILDKKKDILAMKKEALQPLIEVLEDPLADTRQNSIQMLGELRYKEAVPPLCLRLTEDKDYNVRIKAIKALGAIGDPSSIPALSIALLEDKNTTIRSTAAAMLGQIGEYKAVDVLGRALQKDADKQVRKKTIEALTTIGDKRAIPYLEQRLATEADQPTKKAINSALMKLGADIDIPLEIQIENFKQNRDWTKLRQILKQQKNSVLIDQLQTKDRLIQKIVAETLMERTAKFELGTDYKAWRKWYQKSGND